MFDKGSQRSSVMSDVIKRISPPCISSEWQRNILFGNVLTEPRNVKSYEIEVSSLDDSFKTKLIFKETPSICGSIPRIKVDRWINQLKNANIQLADVAVEENDNPTVRLLIGSNYWGLLITSAPVTLGNGLYAVNSKFGWTISGTEGTCSNLNVARYFLNQTRICDLWELEAIGIKPEKTDDVGEIERKQFDDLLRRAADG